MKFFIKCKKCGSIYSSNLKFCSECHAKKPFIYSSFVRIVIPCFIISTLIILIAIFGVKWKNKKNYHLESNTVSSELSHQIYGINQTANFNNNKMTVDSFTISNGNNNIIPQNGNIFLGIKITIENTSDTKETFNSSRLFNVYLEDNKIDNFTESKKIFDSDTLDGTIKPGEILSGYYAVEVPKNWSKLSLEVNSLWITNEKAKFVIYNN